MIRSSIDCLCMCIPCCILNEWLSACRLKNNFECHTRTDQLTVDINAHHLTVIISKPFTQIELQKTYMHFKNDTIKLSFNTKTN